MTVEIKKNISDSPSVHLIANRRCPLSPSNKASSVPSIKNIETQALHSPTKQQSVIQKFKTWLPWIAGGGLAGLLAILAVKYYWVHEDVANGLGNLISTTPADKINDGEDLINSQPIVTEQSSLETGIGESTKDNLNFSLEEELTKKIDNDISLDTKLAEQIDNKPLLESDESKRFCTDLNSLLKMPQQFGDSPFDLLQKSFKQEWVQTLPNALKQEAEFISRWLSNPSSLQQMSEEELKHATKDRPDTFHLLNAYRLNSNSLPSNLQTIVQNYQLSQIFKQYSCRPPQEDEAFLSDDSQNDLEIQQIQTASDRLQAMNPEHIDPNGELTVEWNQIKKDLELAEWASKNPPTYCQVKSLAGGMQQKMTHLENTIAKTAQFVRPDAVIRALLDAKPAKDIDDKLFQHILGDYWGRQSGLEGYSSEKMLEYVLGLLNKQIEALEAHPHCTNEDRLTICRQIFGAQPADLDLYKTLRAQLSEASKLTLLFNNESSEVFSTAILNRLNSLQENESFFFMGGWVNKYFTSGHAIVYEIVKESNHSFSLRIFNRGDGQQYHVFGKARNQDQAIPYLEIEKIEKNRLASISFLAALKELQNSVPTGGKDWEAKDWEASDLYDNLLPYLKGSLNHPPLKKMREVLKVGHCTALSLLGTLEEHLGPKNRLALDIQFKTLSDYYNQKQETLAQNARQRQLLFKGCSQLAKNVRDVFKEGRISLRESEFFQQTIEHIESQVQKAENNFQVSFTTSGLEELTLLLLTKLDHIKTFNFAERKKQHKSLSKLNDSLFFTANPATFAKDCKTWTKKFHSGSKNKEFLAVKEAIKDWIRNLPSQWIDQPQILTRTLSPQEAEAIVQNLAEISHLFIWNQLRVSQREPDRFHYLEGSDLFTIVKLFTLSDVIAKSFADTTGVDLPDLYQLDMDLLLNQSSGHVFLFDPELEDQLPTLQSYWDRTDPPEKREKRGHISFFGLESAPPSNGYRDLRMGSSDSCPSFFKWPFFTWTKEYVQRSEVQQKIHQKHPQLYLQETDFQVIASLYELDSNFDESELKDVRKRDMNQLINDIASKQPHKGILPKMFLALRDISVSVYRALHPFNLKYVTAQYKSNRFSATASFDKKCDVYSWKTFISTFSDRLYPLLAPGDEKAIYNRYSMDLTREDSVLRREGATDSNYFLQEGRDSFGRYQSIYGKKRWIFLHNEAGTSNDRLRVGPDRRSHLTSLDPQSGISAEETQDLLALSAVPELQVIETLGYFHKKLSLFARKEMRTLFLSLMAEPPFLIEQLKKGNDVFAKALSDFVKEGYKFYQDLNNREASMYFLELNQYFSTSVDYVSQQRGKSFIGANFLNTQEELRKMLRQEKLSPEEKTAHWFDLAAALNPKNSLTNEEASELLTAYAWAFFHPVTKQHSFYSRQKEILSKNRLIRFQETLQKQLNIQEQRDEILNAVLKHVFLEDVSYAWNESPTFPRFSTQNNSFEIDVSTGKIYRNNQNVILLPKEVQDADCVKPFLSHSDSQIVKQIAAQGYEWQAPDGSKIRVSQTKTPLIIQREIESNIWAEQIQPPKDCPIPKGLLVHHRNLWVEKTSKDKSQKDKSQKDKSQKDKSQKYWISDPSNGRLVYRIDSFGPMTIITDLNHGWQLSMPPIHSTLHGLDEKEFVLVWVDPNKKRIPVQIDLPRYNISFSIKDKKIYFPDVRGFFFSEKQPHPLASAYPNSIALENQAGETKILCLNSLYADTKSFQDMKKPFFLYDVDKTLKSSSREDNLYLVLLRIQNEEYETAKSLLATFLSPLRSLTEREVQIMKKIVLYERFIPSTLALRLQTLSLLVRNHLDFQGDSLASLFDPVEKSIIKELVWSYEQYKDQIPKNFLLTAQDTKWILKFFPLNLPLQQKIGAVDWSNVEKAWEDENPWDGTHTPSEEMKNFLKEIKIKKQLSISSNLSLLRHKGLAKRFLHFYQVAWQKESIEDYRNWYKYFFGFFPPAKASIEKIAEEIDRALSIIAISQSNSNERIAAILLYEVRHNSRLFARPSLLTEQLKREHPYHCWRDSHCDEIYTSLFAPAKNRLKHFQKMTQQISVEKHKDENLAQNLVKPTSTPNAVVCSKSEYSLPLASEQPLPFPVLSETSYPSSADVSQLSNVFQRKKMPDPAIQHQLNDLSQRLDRFELQPSILYQLNNPQELVQHMTTLTAQAKDLKNQLSEMESTIVSMANKPPLHQNNRILRKLKELSFHKKPLSLRDIFLAFLQSDPAAIKKLNPELTCQEASQIIQKTQSFLTLGIRYQHVSRLHESLEKIHRLPSNTPTEELSFALEEMKTIATANRSYNVKEHPEYLVFEYAKNMMLWPSQVKSLEAMTKEGIFTALEMIMGSGKTAVLLPLLALKRADGKTLSMLTMPEALIPSVATELQESLGSAFSQAIEMFHFDRNSPLDEQALQRILDRMKDAIQYRKAALISSSSLQSFVLLYIEAAAKGKNDDRICLFKEILSLMHTSGSLNIDEMDFIFDVLKAHHFTQGKPSKMPEDMLDAVTHIYRLISENEQLKDQIKWNFLPNSGGINPLTEKRYKALQSTLIQEILKGHNTLDPEIRKFLQSTSYTNKELLAKYLRQENKAEVFEFIDSLPMEIKNTLAVWKEEISRLLLLTGKKQLNEHYGTNPKENDGMAIPYHGSNNPMIGSQYGTDLEILNYTIQMHLANGVSNHIIESEIENLKKRVAQELADNSRLSMKHTQAFKEFQRLAGHRESLHLYSLSLSDIEQIRERVNSDVSLKLDLIRRHILSQVETYSTQLHTSAHIFNSLVKTSNGFSGTLWNFDSFPGSYTKNPSDTEPKTLHLLWSKKCPVSVLEPAASLKDQIAQMYKTHQGSLVDLGGVFRHVDSESVAKTIMQQPIWNKSNIEGVVFYDKEDQQKICVRGQGGQDRIIPFKASEWDPEKIIVYWAQKYTTGSNIRVGSNMKAIVTVGEHSLMRDLLQAVWRLRKLERGQTVSIAVPKEDVGIMTETLRQAGYQMSDPPSLADILVYAKYNEALRIGDDNLRSLRLKLRNVLIQRVWTLLLDPDANTSDLSEAIRELFFKQKSRNAYDHYGKIEEIRPIEEVIDKEIKQLQNGKTFKLFPKADQEQIQAAWRQIINKEKPKIPTSAHLANGFDTQVQVESQVESQVEMQSETKQEIVLSIGFDDAPERSVFLWKEQDLFQKQYFTPSHKVPQIPDASKFPEKSLALPDTEQRKGCGDEHGCAHPMDHLDVSGEDLLAQQGIRPLSAVGKYSDPALLESWNAIPGQKAPIVLVIQDLENNKLKLMRLSQWDALMFQRLLQKDREIIKKSPSKLLPKREHRLALYHLDLGIVTQQGRDPIHAETLENDSCFLRLKTQAKFFNGEIFYSEKELASIRQWAKEVGAKKLKALFLEEILKGKQKAAAEYTKSPLHTLFDEPIFQ